MVTNSKIVHRTKDFKSKWAHQVPGKNPSKII
jgi:hypothetical protein